MAFPQTGGTGQQMNADQMRTVANAPGGLGQMDLSQGILGPQQGGGWPNTTGLMQQLPQLLQKQTPSLLQGGGSSGGQGGGQGMQDISSGIGAAASLAAMAAMFY